MSTKGMMFPQEKPLLAGNPKDSAMAANNDAAAKHTALINATKGGSKSKKLKKKYRGGVGSAAPAAPPSAAPAQVAVPQFQMQYTPSGASGQTPNDTITQLSATSTQNAENAKYDNLAAQKGGYKKKSKKSKKSKKYKKGGNNFKWGCYSGGKTYKKRRTNRSK